MKLNWIEKADILPLPRTREKNLLYGKVVDEFIQSNLDVAKVILTKPEFENIHWETILQALRGALKERQLYNSYKVGIRTFDNIVSMYIYKIG